jgi:hypothetical protein
MNEAHQRFHDWLTAGGEGDPPRDVAVHASVCSGCQRSIDAIDLLAGVNTGLASMPAEPIGREHGRLALAGRLIGATAVIIGATILGVGVSQLIGSQHPSGGVAQASPTPGQDVLGGTSSSHPSSEATAGADVTPRETLTPLGTPSPGHPHTGVTPIPWRSAAPTLAATNAPSFSPIPTAAPSDTPTPTAVPTDTPSPTDSPTPTPIPTVTPPPPPQCADGIDNDGDGFTDLLDPECTDALDNDESVL